jgi:hypothetical protein
MAKSPTSPPDRINALNKSGNHGALSALHKGSGILTIFTAHLTTF